MGKDRPENWIGEFIDIWLDSGPVRRAVLILACIGASTTLSNLAGTIIEWRGLIADMLHYYTQYIRDPIATVINWITFDLLRPVGPFIDAILLYCIYFSGEKRVIGKLSQRSALNSSLFIMYVVITPLAILLIAIAAMYIVDRYLLDGVWMYAAAVSVSIPLIIIVLSFYGGIRSLIMMRRGEFPMCLVNECHHDYYRDEIRKFIDFATPLIFAFIMLAVLASINTGMS